MLSYMQKSMRNKTNRFWKAHTEQEISAIIQTSIFYVDKTCFPRHGHIYDFVCDIVLLLESNHVIEA